MKSVALLTFHLLLIALLCATGCDTTSTSTPRVTQPRFDDTQILQRDDLTLGTELLHRINDPAPLQIDELALYHLNQWLVREAKQENAWQRPELIETLYPTSLRTIQPMNELNRSRLTRSDLDFLHGQIWQRDLSRWVTENPLAEPWASWMNENPNGLDAAQSKQLSAALQLFDWTIRNIQLDAFPSEEKAQPIGTAKAETQLPSARGVPGRGYQRLGYETLLFGHGDAYERMRLFIELCRQQQIDGVLLEVHPTAGAPRCWAVAVLIAKELYLFDPELGLPLPGENRRGVATLSQLVKQPELLDQLDLSEQETYWVTAEDLKSLKVLIAASPEELSLRMWLLEKIEGPQHLETFVDIDQLAERVKQVSALGGAKVELWRVPFDAWNYVSLGFGLRLSLDAALAQEYQRTTAALRAPGTPLRQGRQRHLQGSFDTPQDAIERRLRAQKDGVRVPIDADSGAVEMYLASRPEGRAVADLEFSEYWQQHYGLTPQLSKDPMQRRTQLDYFTSQIERMRDDVTYWLGLVQFEKGEHANAVVWLKQSLDDEDSSDKPWSHGARYNIARSYEALDQSDKAIEFYEAGDSPQSYGNRLRAKWLVDDQP